MSLLSPEQLADTQAVYMAVAQKGYATDAQLNILLQNGQALLDHIEAREQQVKAELQGLLTRKEILVVLEGEDKGRAFGRNQYIHDAAARLGITLD